MYQILKITRPFKDGCNFLYHWNSIQWVPILVREFRNEKALISCQPWYNKDGIVLEKFEDFNVVRDLMGKRAWEAWRHISNIKNLDGTPYVQSS